MPPPDGTYVVMATSKFLHCTECENVTMDLLVANEFVYDEDGTFGIEAVVRYDNCGHLCSEMEADPLIVAMLMETFEHVPEADTDAQQD